MELLSQKEILDLISARFPFAAMAEDRSYWIRIKSFEPRVGMAIHDGDQLRSSLRPYCALNSFERWQEEDPLTGLFIDPLPIQVVAMDSRYEYDLNRDPTTCVYLEAWGKPVWNKPLPLTEHERSLAKHRQFYEMVTALVHEVESAFGSCVVYDVHSFNWQRNGFKTDMPTFNVGTDRVDRARYSGIIDAWLRALQSVTLSCEKVRAAENEVFLGHGYLLTYLSQRFNNTLVLATEIKKVYCDENTQVRNPDVVNELEIGFSRAFRAHRIELRNQLENPTTLPTPA